MVNAHCQDIDMELSRAYRQRGRRYMYVTAILSGSPSIIQIRQWFVTKSCHLMNLEHLYYFYHRYEFCQVTCYMQSSLGAY